jgi:hypothetical protein
MVAGAFFKSAGDNKKVLSIAVVCMLLVMVFVFTRGEVEKPAKLPTIELPDDYIVIAELPHTEVQRAFVASLSSIIVRGDEYHPFFLTVNGMLDEHQMWTLFNMGLASTPKLLFTNSETITASVESQLENVQVFPALNDTLADFKGFNGTLSVNSYEEALWAAPVAHLEDKVIVLGKSTFQSQEEAHQHLYTKHELPANYVIATNPTDYGLAGWDMVRDTEKLLNGKFDRWHIPHLSIMTAQLAAYHDAYVITNVTPDLKEVGDYDGVLNAYCTGLLNQLREISASYGPTEYVCLVGSGSAVPQFECQDYTNPSEPNAFVSSDVMYGFMDEDNLYEMNAAVGRIINHNIQGASNMVVRILAYDLISPQVSVVSREGGARENWQWKTHGSAWNGYEVADQRRQLTPGYFFTRDLEDEGFTYEYVSTRGVSRDRTNVEAGIDLELICQSSGMIAYRGHGSAVGSFYMWGQGNANDDMLSAEEARALFLPPQVFVSCSCSNGHIWGLDLGGNDLNRTFSTSYLYGGCVALIAATEISYSNTGQDSDSLMGEITGDHQWDCNNAIYAFTVDGLFDHEQENGQVGKALQWTVNRYINNHDQTVSPFIREGDAVHWKEATMFACYSDPAFLPSQVRPGANAYDPWHNGPDDLSL